MMSHTAEAAEPILPPDQSLGDVTDQIAHIPLNFPTRGRWLLALGLSSLLLVLFFVSVTVLFARGVGVWGLNIPVNWAFAIHNYVWWLGIGHAGTLISALLLLTRQKWRGSLNRFAETMTLFAASMAGLFPIFHLGRPYYLYWIVPYPNVQDVWPQWRSALVWDFWAVGTYIAFSALFWYAGLIPDLAMLREVFSQTGARSGVLQTDGEDMQNRDHACFFSAAHAAKDSGIALKLAKTQGLNLPLAAATKKQYDRMIASGLGELDKSGIAELTFPGRQGAPIAKA